MARLVSTTVGIGRLDGADVELLDVDYRDLGHAFAEGADSARLAELGSRRRRPLAEVRLLAPIPRPPKIWAAGWAYRAHREEANRPEDDGEPFFFLKAPSSVIGPGEAIRLPELAPDRVDYEGEIAVVIGRRAAAIGEDRALSYIAGYTAANDVSARDVQKGEREGRLPNIGLAKSFDTFTPLGPCLTTADELGDDLLLETKVDGETRQSARTTDLVYSIAAQISYISHYTTLEPGDVILTGTPAGVAYPDGSFLRHGSVVNVTVEGVGVLENPVVSQTNGHRSATEGRPDDE